jgi:energy-converting hydrogenase A subunit R
MKMAEYDPMEELGFIHDKQLVCSCLGFLHTNNSTRDLCSKFIRNGDKFYDLIARYEDVSSYVLNRKDNRSGNTMRALTPFLKAFGATDYAMLQCCKESLRLMPEAKKVMNYLTDVLPTFVSTSSYEHQVMALCEALELPISICDYSTVDMDSYDMSRSEGRSIRDFASRIDALKVPRSEYRLNTPVSLDKDETKLIEVMDDIFDNKIKELTCNSLMTGMKSVGANEKAYALLDIRKRTMIDFDGTAYIGGDLMDYQAMDLIRDGSGLSLAFNGSEFAVHGSNIAVISRDCTVAAVLVEEFYNQGIEAVYDLVSNWDRASLKKMDCPDKALMDTMLAANPRKLPEVYIVNRSNVTEIALKSDAYRKKLLRSNY